MTSTATKYARKLERAAAAKCRAEHRAPEPWDCYCHAGCQSCHYDARCPDCGRLMNRRDEAHTKMVTEGAPR